MRKRVTNWLERGGPRLPFLLLPDARAAGCHRPDDEELGQQILHEALRPETGGRTHHGCRGDEAGDGDPACRTGWHAAARAAEYTGPCTGHMRHPTATRGSIEVGEAVLAIAPVT